jgi:hypothetical protein
LVATSSPKRPILSLSASSTWPEAFILNLNIVVFCFPHVCECEILSMTENLLESQETCVLLVLCQVQYDFGHTVST